jgi:phage terminase small subunit
MRAISQEEKEKQGTYEPSKEIDSLKLPEWDGSKMPAAPSKWPYPIQKLWNERCKDLSAAGYLASAFLPALKEYCYYVLMAEEAREKLDEEGFIENKMTAEGLPYETISKWVSIREIAVKGMERIGARYGFTPLDVQKIPAVKKDDSKTMSLLK